MPQKPVQPPDPEYLLTPTESMLSLLKLWVAVKSVSLGCIALSSRGLLPAVALPWLPCEHLLHRHQWVLRAVLLLWHERYVPCLLVLSITQAWHEFVTCCFVVLPTAVLTLYFTRFLHWDENFATAIYHTFVALCYLTPILGAIIADSWLGKFKWVLPQKATQDLESSPEINGA